MKNGELPDFNLGSDGILRFRNRVVVPKDEELKREILEESHRSRYTVHPGGGKVYHDLKGLYWWDNMKADVDTKISPFLFYSYFCLFYLFLIYFVSFSIS